MNALSVCEGSFVVNINTETLLFSKRDLRRLIIPLIIEQTLSITIGMADSMMVSNVGEAAISGINLVDSINNLLIGIFSALATGGTVVVSQYLGRRERDHANQAAKQLLFAVTCISIVIMAITIIGNSSILGLVYANIDAEVMKNAETYFFLSALSYPFLAIYNSGAALFRSQGNSQVSMYTALVVNVVNVGFNALFIYGFEWGVAGAGIATLIARATAAVVVMVLLRNEQNPIFVRQLYKIRPHFQTIRRILNIGIPTGLENGIFQIGKILVATQVAGFGTAAIAANAVASSMAGFQCIPGNGISLAIITVVGQCVGADRYDEARYYVKKLFTYSYSILVGLNLIMFAAYPLILGLYNLQPETESVAWTLSVAHGIGACTIWALSFSLPNVLRAAGDVRFTMIVSVASMWIFRIMLCMVFSYFTDFGIYGVWAAMFADWICRSTCFVWRYRSNRWQGKKAIE